jgi:DNA-binding transcriptional ArsR family regulator
MHADTHQLDRVFFALSDATRRAILEKLAGGSATVGELAQPFEISAPAISRHMRILESAGLVVRQKHGREHHCQLSTNTLRTAEDWINFHRHFWESRLDALEQYLDQNKTKGAGK